MRKLAGVEVIDATGREPAEMAEELLRGPRGPSR
jgi:hypothetical protein